MLLVGGCVTHKPELQIVNTPAWQSRQTTLADLDTWRLNGRVALQMEEQGWNLSLSWERGPDQQQLDLSGPLGRGHIRVRQNASGAELIDNKQQHYHAANAQQLIYQTTGWYLPINSLAYWIKGIPEPGKNNKVSLDEQGRLRYLQQSGWYIEYIRYVRTGDHELPDRLYLSRSAQPGHAQQSALPEVKVRLAITRWVLDNSGTTPQH